MPQPGIGTGPPAGAGPSRRPSRRSLLLGGAAVVLAGAGGTGAGFLRRREAPPPAPNPPPAQLLAAAERERQLIADLDATTGGPAALRTILGSVRDDHAAHLATFEQLLAGYDPAPSRSGSVGHSRPAVPGSSRPSTVRGTARTARQLQDAEQSAATLTGRAAAETSGRLAVVLASVSASESSHAALIG